MEGGVEKLCTSKNELGLDNHFHLSIVDKSKND